MERSTGTRLKRIGLIVVLSQDSEKIEVSHIDWAWDYVLFYTKEMN